MIALSHRRFISTALRGVPDLDRGVCAYAEMGRASDLEGALADAERIAQALRDECDRIGVPVRSPRTGRLAHVSDA